MVANEVTIPAVKIYTQEQYDVAIRSARESAKRLRDEWFVEQVLEYDEGCTEEKVRFLESIGLDSYIPERTGTITISFTASWSYDEDGIQDEIDRALGSVNFEAYVDSVDLS